MQNICRVTFPQASSPPKRLRFVQSLMPHVRTGASRLCGKKDNRLLNASIPDGVHPSLTALHFQCSQASAPWDAGASQLGRSSGFNVTEPQPTKPCSFQNQQPYVEPLDVNLQKALTSHAALSLYGLQEACISTLTRIPGS